MAGSKRDVGWEFGELVDGTKCKVKCKLCDNECSGINRLKKHIAGVTGEVPACEKSSQAQKKKCKEALKKRRATRKENVTKKSKKSNKRLSELFCNSCGAPTEFKKEMEQLKDNLKKLEEVIVQQNDELEDLQAYKDAWLRTRRREEQHEGGGGPAMRTRKRKHMGRKTL